MTHAVPRPLPLLPIIATARRAARLGACLLGALPLALAAQTPPAGSATTPAELLAAYGAQAGAAGSAQRGEKFFNTNFGKEMGWSCASCHGRVPTGMGRNEATEKPIKPLAPAFNPARFTDKRQVEFYFKLNCKDVVGRECTAAEKADLLAWLVTLKP